MANGYTIMTGDGERFPILASLLRAGAVFVKRGEYVSRASEPSVMAPEGLVSLGTVGDEHGTERYLQRFPHPNQW